MAKLKILKDPVTGESFYPYTHEKAITDDNGNEVIAAIKNDITVNTTNINKNKSDIAANISNITKNANDIKTLQKDLSSVRQQAYANKEEIAELNNKKITKFYASNLGETTLNDSDKGKIQDMILYGKSEQKSYSGKNLMNPTLETTIFNGVTCTNNGDGTYTLNGTATNNNDIQIFSGNMTFVNAKLIGCPKGGSDTTYRMFMFYDNVLSNNVKDYGSGSNEISVDDKNVKVIINVYSGVTYNNLVFKPMITTDTSATYDDFEPYVGGIPSPNPNYPQEIKSVVNPTVKVCGKNLFNPDSLVENGACIYSNDEIKVIDVNKLANITVPLSIKAGNNINLSFYVKGVKEQSFIVGLKYTNGNRQGVTISINANEFVYNSKTINLSKDLEGIFFGGSGGLGNGTIIKKLQIEIGSQSTEYEPHKEQIASLPYTLNAIPVSSGGNVTIDGQEYIADYVDIENKKLVRMVGEVDLGTLGWDYVDSLYFRSSAVSNIISNTGFWTRDGSVLKSTHYIHSYSLGSVASDKTIDKSISAGNYNKSVVVKDLSYSDANTFKQAMNGVIMQYQLAKPTGIDLTDEEVQEFKELATYYPTTNIFVTSDQLDGYTTFNYPLSMANGWNFIKEQLGDTRDYIYGMDLQSAEAYINSEYAVALAELEV